MQNIESLRCVACGGTPLARADGSRLMCVSCGQSYGSFKGCPVLIRADNALFPPSGYQDADPEPDSPSERGALRNLGIRLRRAIPGRSINLSRNRLFRRIASEHGQKSLRVLVVGCGTARAALETAFSTTQFSFVHTDIDKAALADVMCDAHDLPFTDAAFDGVITTAVMEHVLRPDTVAAEIVRVLAPGGFVYSEVPFLQAVHEGAYDFTRFSLSGHRRLFERFEEIEGGMVAGPATALVWQLTELSRAMFSNPRLASAAVLSCRTLFFWIKYFDYLIARNPRALDAASCTYFYGQLRATPVDPSEIIRRYGHKSV